MVRYHVFGGINMEFRRIMKGMTRIAGIKIWIASLVPLIVGAVLAYAATAKFELQWFALAVIGILLIETGKHCFNDIVDYGSGVDRSIEPDKVTPFSGGKKVLTENLLTPKEAKHIGIITTTAAAIIGIYIAYFHEPRILIIGLSGVFIACAYSLPPFSFCYRGLGELFVFITYGPLILLGMYVVMTGRIDILPVLVSIPIGFLIANVLWINQYPDYEADKMNNKKNWVVRLGKQKSLYVYSALYIASYAAFLLIAVYTRNPWWIICFTGVPLALKSYKIAKIHYENIPELVKANKATVDIYQLTGFSIIITVIISDFMY